MKSPISWVAGYPRPEVGLAMGRSGVTLFDEKFKGSDEFATAKLAKAIEKDGGADLILAGVQPTISVPV